MMEHWLQVALDMGFDVAAPCAVASLKPMEEVRQMCQADKCRAFGKNWACPPHCGTLAECGKKISGYSHGMLLQTVGYMTKDIDSRCYRETERRHLESFQKLAMRIRLEHPEALCLGAGGCRVCPKCAYPEPCRFPEQAHPSMEGYGLFVTRVCRDNDVAYCYGPRTITYCACILFNLQANL